MISILYIIISIGIPVIIGICIEIKNKRKRLR